MLMEIRFVAEYWNFTSPKTSPWSFLLSHYPFFQFWFLWGVLSKQRCRLNKINCLQLSHKLLWPHVRYQSDSFWFCLHCKWKTEALGSQKIIARGHRPRQEGLTKMSGKRRTMRKGGSAIERRGLRQGQRRLRRYSEDDRKEYDGKPAQICTSACSETEET